MNHEKTTEDTIVDQLYEDFQELVDLLEKKGEISLLSAVDNNFKKALLIAVASHFEHTIREDLRNFIKQASANNQLVIEFTNQRAITRFHELFQWKDTNANSFFGLFGEPFKIYMKEEVRNDEALHNAIRAFLEIGRERNLLVHGNYAEFVLEKSAHDIYASYKTALPFIKAIPKKLREWQMPDMDI